MSQLGQVPRDDLVLGQIRPPLHRRIVARIAYPLMRIGVPGAAHVWFWALLGQPVDVIER